MGGSFLVGSIDDASNFSFLFFGDFKDFVICSSIFSDLIGIGFHDLGGFLLPTK